MDCGEIVLRSCMFLVVFGQTCWTIYKHYHEPENTKLDGVLDCFGSDAIQQNCTNYIHNVPDFIATRAFTNYTFISARRTSVALTFLISVLSCFTLLFFKCDGKKYERFDSEDTTFYTDKILEFVIHILTALQQFHEAFSSLAWHLSLDWESDDIEPDNLMLLKGKYFAPAIIFVLLMCILLIYRGCKCSSN